MNIKLLMLASFIALIHPVIYIQMQPLLLQKGDEVKKISVLKLVLSKASRVVSEFQAVFQSYHLITDFHIKQMELKVAYKL